MLVSPELNLRSKLSDLNLHLDEWNRVQSLGGELNASYLAPLEVIGNELLVALMDHFSKVQKSFLIFDNSNVVEGATALILNGILGSASCLTFKPSVSYLIEFVTADDIERFATLVLLLGVHCAHGYIVPSQGGSILSFQDGAYALLRI
jgi:hypothetical protein